MEEVTKKLNPSDVDRKLQLPENCLKNLPRGQETFLKIKDEDGIVWTFRCKIPPGGHSRPVLYGEWLLFVRQKCLKVGDIIVIVFNKQKARAAADTSGDLFEIKVKKTRN
ncbi:hypothetical protein BDE02_04G188500 [Populus trichocarpa]|jgi:hypothetical protein|nr:hypothetical protein BDE02_04G188500 [Populus trichocarpa]